MAEGLRGEPRAGHGGAGAVERLRGLEGGYADAAENFLENEQWLDQPPDAKRRPGQEPAPVVDPAAVAALDRHWAYFLTMSPEEQAGVRAEFKNRALAERPIDTPGMKGAVAAVLESRRVAV